MSRVHVYISGTHQAEPDTGMPLIRPVYFKWMEDEVNVIKEFEHQLVEESQRPNSASLTEEISQVLSPTDRANPEVPEQEKSVSGKEFDEPLIAAEDLQQPGSMVTAQASPLKPSCETIQTESSGVGELQIDNQTLKPMDLSESEVGEGRSVYASALVDGDDTDITDLLASGEELNAAEQMASAGETNSAGAPVPDLQSPVVQGAEVSVTHPDKSCAEVPSEMRQLHVVMKYMASQVDARRFACKHCGISSLNGNTLARHLVEECGSNTVTLNPNPALVKARLEAAEQHRLQQEMHQHEQNEAGILFEAADTALSSTEGLGLPTQATIAEASSHGDVIMVTMAPEQLSSYGVMGSDQAMVNNELVTQLGPTGTTIDVTNANGEVVQQFIIPDDLQLEEGQTLVVIQGEDGQPQLAIVNQADLLETDDSRMMLQSEDDDANSMLMYTNTIGQTAQAMDGVVVQQEEEKENHEYAM